MRTKLTSLALAAVMTLAAAGMAYTDTGGGTPARGSSISAEIP